MISGCVETICDTVFDETNVSQKEQVDIDLVDDEEAPCDALQKMAISDIRPQDLSNQPQVQSLNDTTPPAQGFDQDEDKDEHHDQVQEESNDQGGDEDDEDNKEALPHPRVHHNVQRDHPVNNIDADIEKGVTTRSCVTNFLNITHLFLPLSLSR
jgi:hypothetical protein